MTLKNYVVIDLPSFAKLSDVASVAKFTETQI